MAIYSNLYSFIQTALIDKLKSYKTDLIGELVSKKFDITFE